MNTIKQQIIALKQEFARQMADITALDQLEQLRISFLGRKGKIAELTTSFEKLSLADKKEVGPLLKELREYCNIMYTAQKEYITSSQTKTHSTVFFDVTAYKTHSQRGSLHIYTHLIEQLEDIFMSMGYTPIDGPELESDHYNFNALNIPEHHPARDAVDTFWLTLPHMLMRTHTSTVQIRAMEKQILPLAAFSSGRVYRNEATDASHDFMFMQMEGMFIDKNVSMAHLLGTAKTFLQHIFRKNDINIRVRPGYFPFVEPGVEIDCSCPFCTHGCSVCKYTTWIELLGAGLIHPNVLHCSGINPAIYSGFAFGMGLERLAMIIYNINDIRLFHNNTHTFLAQF